MLFSVVSKNTGVQRWSFIKTSAIWLVEFYSFKPNMGTDRNSNKIWYVLIYFVLDNMVYMGTVNNSSKAWHVVLSPVYSNNKQV